MSQDNDEKDTFRVDRKELPREGSDALQPSHEPVIHEGNWVGSRYQVSELIGEGAFSKVYRAWDALLRRWIALKLYAALDVSLNVAMDEIKWQARIQHPNLMPILDAGVDPSLGRYFVAMPLYPGETLDALIERMGPLPVKIALVYCDQVLSALDFIERGRGGIHGDIKPANIWVTRDGSAVLMDYGVATVAEEGERIGTPGYGAPETLNGITDIRSDIFSVGCVLYLILTGIKPFANDYDVVHKSLAPPSTLRSDVRPYLDQITLKAIDKDSEKRFQSAREMQNAIRHPPIWKRSQDRPHFKFPFFRTSLHFLSRSVFMLMFHPRAFANMLIRILLMIVFIAVMVSAGMILAVRGLSILHGGYPWVFALLVLAIGAIVSAYLSKRFSQFSGRFWDTFISLIAPGLGDLNAGSFHAGIAFLSIHSIFMLTWWLPSVYRGTLKHDQIWIFVIAMAVWIASVIHNLQADPARTRKPVDSLPLLLGIALGAIAAAPLYVPHIFDDSVGKILVLGGLPVAVTVIAGLPAGVLASIFFCLLSLGEGITGSLLLWQIALTCLACGWAFALSKAGKPFGALGVLFANMGNASLLSGSSFRWSRVLLEGQFWEQALVQTIVVLLAIELGYTDSWLWKRMANIRTKLKIIRPVAEDHKPSPKSEATHDNEPGKDGPTHRFR